MVWALHLRLRVKELATSKGVTQAHLSRAADINVKTLQAMYRDPYRNVSYSTLYKIAKVLGVPITDLVEDMTDTAMDQTGGMA